MGKDYILKNRELHIYCNDTVKVKNDTLSSSIDTVFAIIQENNKITAKEIAKNLGISLSTAKRRIKVLKDSRKIERVGSDKTGYWRVF